MSVCDICAMRDDVPHTGREASRLTDDDREACDARLVEILAGFAQALGDATRRRPATWWR